MVDVRYATNHEFPSAHELRQIKQIRDESSSEIQVLKAADPDVIGDLRICRFLRAKSGDVKEAGTWFREFLRWRVQVGIEIRRAEVVGRSPEDMLLWYMKRRNPYLPLCPYAGRNADGHIIWYFRQGLIDPEKFISHRPIPLEEDAMTIYLISEWTLWYVDMLSRNEGHMVYAVKVHDFQGLGSGGRSVPIFVPKFRKMWLENLMTCLTHHYCEHDSLFVAVNTPLAFRAAFQVAKLLFSKRQVSKFRIVGDSAKPEVRKVLQRVISDALVTEYGGQVQEAPGAFPLATAEEINMWFETRKHVPIEYVDTVVAKPNNTDDAKVETGSSSSQDTRANSTEVPNTPEESPSLGENAQVQNAKNAENNVVPPAIEAVSPQDDQIMIESVTQQTQCGMFSFCQSA